MPPDLRTRFDISWQGRPAHMSSKDYAIWQRFRREYGVGFSALYYDVGLGTMLTTPHDPNAPVNRMWARLTAFRADVVGESPEHWTLIEIRDNAGPGAIGSLITYRDLWLRDPPDERPLRLWLVTDAIHADLRPSLRALDVELYVV